MKPKVSLRKIDEVLMIRVRNWLTTRTKNESNNILFQTKKTQLQRVDVYDFEVHITSSHDKEQ